MGSGAILAAGLLFVGRLASALVSIGVGASIIIFELVETAVIGFDVWLHALAISRRWP